MPSSKRTLAPHAMPVLRVTRYRPLAIEQDVLIVEFDLPHPYDRTKNLTMTIVTPRGMGFVWINDYLHNVPFSDDHGPMPV